MTSARGVIAARDRRRSVGADLQLAIGVAAMLSVAWLGCGGAAPEDPCASALSSGELLTNVTARSATVSGLPSRDVEFRVRYAEVGSRDEERSARVRGRAGELALLELAPLAEHMHDASISVLVNLLDLPICLYGSTPRFINR